MVRLNNQKRARLRQFKKLHTRKLFATISLWVLAISLSSCSLFLFHSRVFAQREPTISEISQFIAAGNTPHVTVELQRSGFYQVYYSYNGNVYYLTDESYDNKDVYAEGRFAVWERWINGRSQIVLHDFLSKMTLQLTSSSINRNPRVDSFGNVVWERWDGEHWQVHHYSYFSDEGITKLTDEPDSAILPDVNNQEVVYARKINGVWETLKHQLKTDEREVIASGSAAQAGRPKFLSDGTITTDLTSYISAH